MGLADVLDTLTSQTLAVGSEIVAITEDHAIVSDDWRSRRCVLTPVIRRLR